MADISGKCDQQTYGKIDQMVTTSPKSAKFPTSTFRWKYQNTYDNKTGNSNGEIPQILWVRGNEILPCKFYHQTQIPLPIKDFKAFTKLTFIESITQENVPMKKELPYS